MLSGHGYLTRAGGETMTVRASQSETHIGRHANDNVAFERVRPPTPVWFAGTLVVMNIVSAMLSLMA
jgi:hypothetical protein